ncbi:MAG: class I SAM-dependent methyltransferase [Vampirovibrionales bacterium]
MPLVSAISHIATHTPVYTPLFASNKTGLYNDVYSGNEHYGSNPYYVRLSKKHRKEHPMNGHLFSLIQQYVPVSSPILELGCHQGNNLLPLAQQGYQMYGVDLEKELLKALQEKARGKSLENNVTVKQWDFAEAGDTPWPKMKGQFKAIYATHVFSHLSGPHLIKTVQALKDQLAPGGLFIATILDKSKERIGIGWKIRIKFNLLVYKLLYWIDKRPFSEESAGFVHHSQQEVDQAFAGLTLLKNASRPFYRGEPKRWVLPEKRIRWVVYQKPPA